MTAHGKMMVSGLLVVLLVLAACGGEEESGVTLQAVDRQPTATPAEGDTSAFAGLPEPVAGALTLPAVADFSGSLLFLKDETLYRGRFDGQEPELLAELVHPYLLTPAPGGERLVMLAGEEHEVRINIRVLDYELAVLELDTLARFPLLEVGTRNQLFSTMNGWSPGGDAVMVSNRDGLALALLAGEGAPGAGAPEDGTPEVRRLPGLTFFTAWLDDGRLLILDVEEGAENQQQPPLVAYRHDPASRESTPLDVEIPDTGSMGSDLLAVLEPVFYEAGLVYDDSFTAQGGMALLDDGATRVYISSPESAQFFNVEICDTWTIQQRPRAGGAPETIYSVAETTFLTDLAALPDGSLLFLRWALSECRFTGTMEVELLRLVPGEAEPTVIAAPIDPGMNGNPNDIRFMGYQRGHKFDVGPDGRYVFWIGGGLAARASSVHVTDLETGATATLLTEVLTPSGEGSFEGVYWLP